MSMCAHCKSQSVSGERAGECEWKERVCVKGREKEYEQRDKGVEVFEEIKK